jgi:hypothetical protein
MPTLTVDFAVPTPPPAAPGPAATAVQPAASAPAKPKKK